jgi:D-sedoheptulose 7-phosphate isomerase
MTTIEGRPRLILDRLFVDQPALAPMRADMEKAFGVLEATYERGGKVLACGYGGSAADAEHIVGELTKGFLQRRPLDPAFRRRLLADAAKGAEAPLEARTAAEHIAGHLQGALPAIPLTGGLSLSTAFANDVAPELVFAQQLFGYGRTGDTLVAISTSGDSAGILHAIRVARAMGISVVGLTGGTGGRMAPLCDVALVAPERETYRVQECHLPLYHALCAMLEARFFPEDEPRTLDL